MAAAMFQNNTISINTVHLLRGCMKPLQQSAPQQGGILAIGRASVADPIRDLRASA